MPPNEDLSNADRDPNADDEPPPIEGGLPVAEYVVVEVEPAAEVEAEVEEKVDEDVDEDVDDALLRCDDRDE